MTYLRKTANAVFLLSWTTAALAADAPASTKDSSSVTLSNPLAAQSLERLSATVDRPLFSPNRRPPAPPAAPTPQLLAPPAPPPDLVLSGIVTDGERARAVVLVGGEKKILRAQIGDEIDGWTVFQIEGRRLVLSRDGRFVTFTLFNHEVGQRISVDGPLQRQQQNSSPVSQNAGNQKPSPQQNSSPAGQNVGRRPGRMGE
jgi:general secretion pathway protein N